jgi:choloylglycine hydrolase
LTHLTYYFELTTSPNVVWVEFSNLDFTNPAPLALDPDDETLVGDVTSRLAPAHIPF